MPEGPWTKFAGGAEADVEKSGPWARFTPPAPAAKPTPENVVMKGPEAEPTDFGHEILGGAQKVANEYTMGMGSKISAGMAAPFVTAATGMPIGEAYDKSLEDVDKRSAEFSAAHPKVSAGLGVAGALANPLNRKLLNPAELAETFTTRGMARNALTGGAFGGTEAAGHSRGSLKDEALQTAKGAGEGAALGIAAPALLRGGQKAIGAVRAAKDIANSSLSTGAQAAARELASQGIDVSYMTKVPEAAKGMVRGYFANTVIGGIPVRSAARRVAGQVGQAFDQTLDHVGKALDAAGAGAVIHHGINVATRAFKAQASKLYTKADNLISPAGMKMMVKTDNLRGALTDKNDILEGLKLQKTLGDPDTEKMSKEILSGIKEANKKGRMTYETLKAIRTKVGEHLDTGVFADTKQRYWKKLYGALSEDMATAAKAAGPDAHKAAVEANEFYKHGRQEIEDLVSKYGSGVHAEKVFQSVSNMDTLKNAPGRVEHLMGSIPRSARKTVGATVIKRLGQVADGGEFSANQWETSWSKISPKARQALAGSPENAAELDKLARNIARTKPLTKEVAETGMKGVGMLTDWSAAANILNPTLWPVAIGKVVMDAAGGWFLTHPQNIRELNQVMESGDRTKGAALLRKAAEHVLDDDHKKMLLDAADFLVRNRNGVIGMEAGDGNQG